MEKVTLLLFFVVTLSQTISIGPAVTVLLTNFFCYGIRSSIKISLAFRCGEVIVIGAAFLITSVFHVSEKLFLVVKVIGGGYLIYLGVASMIKSVTSKKRLLSDETNRVGFLQALLVPAMNPKALIFFIGFIPSFISLKAGAYSYSMQFFILGSIFIAISFVSDMFFLCLAEGAKRVIGDRITGVMTIVGSLFLIGTGCFFINDTLWPLF